MGIESVGTPGLWIRFTIFALSMLALDLGVFHRRAHAISIKEALLWSIVWMALALTFNAGVYSWFGATHGLEFLTGYLIEKALAVDNIFVFAVIFSYFAVPVAYQHRVLFWGILGALVLRAIFIVLGAALLQKFHWVIYIFGAFLILTGVKLLLQGDDETHPERNPVFRLFKRMVRSVSEYHSGQFFLSKNGKWYATPLLLVLVSIEVTDVIFALDSIPAIFAVTSDPFIVYTSNIFAILGLRSLYFLLAGLMDRFIYLRTGLALVLGFVGIKMILVDYFPLPRALFLGVIALILGVTIAVSMAKTKNHAAAEGPK